MFVHATTVVLAIVASAIGGTVNQCNNGQIQCCDNLMSSSQASNALGLDLGDIVGMIGLNCNDIIPVAGGGTSCSQQAACCSGTEQVGLQLINVGCSPINL